MLFFSTISHVFSFLSCSSLARKGNASVSPVEHQVLVSPLQIAQGGIQHAPSLLSNYCNSTSPGAGGAGPPAAPAGAEHPEAPRNHAPQTRKAGGRGARERSGRAAPGAGPTEPGGPGRHCGGAARRAKRPRTAARGEPPLSCYPVTPAPHIVAQVFRYHHPWGPGGRSPLTSKDTSLAHRDPPGTLRTPVGFLPGPSSLGNPAGWSHGPRRDTASTA